MASITDDRGYNQGFASSKSTTVRMQRRTEMLLSEMDLSAESRILEIGCGTGEVSFWLASRSPARVTGTDLCVPFIESARRNFKLPNLQYEVVDVNAPSSFPDAHFDYIVGNGILHHLYNHIDDACATLKRLLKDGGKILFLEPNLYNPYIYLIFSFPLLRKLAKLEPDEMAFSKRWIADKLKRSGFSDIQVEYKDFLLPGIPAFLIRPSIVAGAVLEWLPLVRMLSQSIFIRARKASLGVSASE